MPYAPTCDWHLYVPTCDRHLYAPTTHLVGRGNNQRMGEVRTTIDQLLTASVGPVTFLDAIKLVRRIKQLDSSDLDALVQLHDHARATNGAKEVLGDFLRGKAQSMAYERAYSERVLTLEDSGRTVRARVGHTLRLLLDTRSHRGGAWKVQSINDDAMTFTSSGMGGDWRYTSAELALRRAGRYSVTLFEHLSPPLRSTPKSKEPTDDDKLFSLDVIIEP